MSNKIKDYMPLGFVLSLVLNGFLLGFILASPPWHGFMPPPDPAKRLYEAAQQLPEENRAAVVAILDRYTDRIDPRRNMAGFKDIRAMLTSENLNPDALTDLFTRVSKQHEEMGRSMGAMFQDIIRAIPDSEQRIKFFERALPPEPPFPPSPEKHRK